MAETIFKFTCRTCNSESMDFENIYDTKLDFDDDGSPPMFIYEILNTLGFMKKPIMKDDDLPNNICQTCLNRLKSAKELHRSISVSQSEFEIALKYENRRRSNNKFLTKSKGTQPEDSGCKVAKQFKYDVHVVDDQVYADGESGDIEAIEMTESDMETMAFQDDEARMSSDKEEETGSGEYPMICVICKRKYKSPTALRFHQTAVHRGIYILND